MARSCGLASGSSQRLQARLVAPALLLLLLLQPSSAHWRQESKHHSWPKLKWSKSARCPPPARRHLPPLRRPPPPADDSSSCEICYTMMATYIGPEPGAEPVPPRWRYSKDTCTRMGNQLAGALNAYAESAADAQEDSSSGRNEYGMRSSRFMLKPFTSRGCIAEDEYGFRGAQVCGSFRSAEAADALVATLMDDSWRAAHVLLKHLGRQGTLCQLPGYQFYLTTFVAPDKPWGVLKPEGVCSKFFFSAEVLC